MKQVKLNTQYILLFHPLTRGNGTAAQCDFA